jgi:plasmid stability protein
MWITCSHDDDMSIMIQIRNVPDALHRRAKARAALEGVTLSDLALRALEREIRRPSVGEIAARIREMEPMECAGGGLLVREERDAR